MIKLRRSSTKQDRSPQMSKGRLRTATLVDWALMDPPITDGSTVLVDWEKMPGFLSQEITVPINNYSKQSTRDL